MKDRRPRPRWPRAVLLLFFIGSEIGTGFAGSPQPELPAPASIAPDDERFAKNRRRWESLPRAARERLRRLYRRLDPATRKQLLAALRDLSTERRARFRRHKQQLRGMTDTRRRQIRERHRALRQFFRSLPAAERERLAALPRPRFHREIRRRLQEHLLSRLGPEARARFRELPREQRRAFLARRLRSLDRDPHPGRRRQQLRRLGRALRELPPRQRRFLLDWRPGDPIPQRLRVPARMWRLLEGLNDAERRELRRRLRSDRRESDRLDPDHPLRPGTRGPPHQ